MLRRIAATPVSSVREGDAVCRYGGDEFLLILRKTSREELNRIVERIEQRVHEFWEPSPLMSPKERSAVSPSVALTGDTRLTVSNAPRITAAGLFTVNAPILFELSLDSAQLLTIFFSPVRRSRP